MSRERRPGESEHRDERQADPAWNVGAHRDSSCQVNCSRVNARSGGSLHKNEPSSNWPGASPVARQPGAESPERLAGGRRQVSAPVHFAQRAAVGRIEKDRVVAEPEGTFGSVRDFAFDGGFGGEPSKAKGPGPQKCGANCTWACRRTCEREGTDEASGPGARVLRRARGRDSETCPGKSRLDNARSSLPGGRRGHQSPVQNLRRPSAGRCCRVVSRFELGILRKSPPGLLRFVDQADLQIDRHSCGNPSSTNGSREACQDWWWRRERRSHLQTNRSWALGLASSCGLRPWDAQS